MGRMGMGESGSSHSPRFTVATHGLKKQLSPLDRWWCNPVSEIQSNAVRLPPGILDGTMTMQLAAFCWEGKLLLTSTDPQEHGTHCTVLAKNGNHLKACCGREWSAKSCHCEAQP